MRKCWRPITVAALLTIAASPGAMAQAPSLWAFGAFLDRALAGRLESTPTPSLPDPRETPGALNPAVTQDTIGETICVRGWTKTVRPDRAFTWRVKRGQMDARGPGLRAADFELDHLVPLELGGAPDDVRNLWLEPRAPEDGWTADRKDELEYALNRLVCSGRLSLAEAQRAMAGDWPAAYRIFLGGDR